MVLKVLVFSLMSLNINLVSSTHCTVAEREQVFVSFSEAARDTCPNKHIEV